MKIFLKVSVDLVFFSQPIVLFGGFLLENGFFWGMNASSCNQPPFAEVLYLIVPKIFWSPVRLRVSFSQYVIEWDTVVGLSSFSRFTDQTSSMLKFRQQSGVTWKDVTDIAISQFPIWDNVTGIFSFAVQT